MENYKQKRFLRVWIIRGKEGGERKHDPLPFCLTFVTKNCLYSIRLNKGDYDFNIYIVVLKTYGKCVM